MDNKNLLNLLDTVSEQDQDTYSGERYLVIDGLNLFFRNFAMLNMVNSKGTHIGGLGGFLRSLGALIRQIEPTQIYLIFDGPGATIARKNINTNYKSNRNILRITNWEIFEDIEEEHESKVDQLIRLITYLKTLPLNLVSVEKAEADDVIAYLSKILVKSKDDQVFIVSSDMDFLQLVDENVVVYRPIEKKYYTKQKVKEKFGVLKENFLIYKTLLGDVSDNIKGVKGLGIKKLFTKFPELKNELLSLDDIIKICENKFKKHIIYARILDDINSLKDSYKIMDLSNPLLSEHDKNYIKSIVMNNKLDFLPSRFLKLYEEDELGGMIRNTEFWLNDIFKSFIKK